MHKWTRVLLGAVVCVMFGGMTAFATPQPTGELKWPQGLATHSPQPAGDLEEPEWLNTPALPQ
ncbi:hypothetical protein [Alicyclobacillus shizuokensis]|uniref:hypothetical protein n=1 Tax=Alicyclobacillus shizuokensis TaxID=392014 RepID=UPI00082B4D61|nr:hypothetical protein [Alicyclobacillus shizuokensis]MCL6627368.1 hypothetical protein [Alicyclobacillus shizuokensis]